MSSGGYDDNGHWHWNDDERFQVGEARRVLSAWDDEQAQFGGPVLSRENVLADQIRNLLAVVDAVAPKEDDDA